MTDTKKNGLVIRRKKADLEAAAPEAAVASAEAASDATAEQPAPAPEEAPKAAPAPAPEAGKRVAHGKAEGGARVWRAEVAPKAAEPEEEASRYERPEAMPTVDDFAALLGDAPMAEETPDVGARVRARVAAIGSESLFLTLGTKSEGIIPTSSFVNDEGELTVAVGDEVEAVVVRIDADGIKLATALSSADGGAELLEDARDNLLPVEGKVVGTNKGGFEVEVMGRRAFCPFSQIALEGAGDEPDLHVGNGYHFLVQRVEEDGRNVVVSRAALQRKEREERAGDTLALLRVDAEFDGVVTRIADYGAFVDIGGVDGLLHISEMAWARLDHPSEMVSVGDKVRVRVVRIDDVSDPKRPKIALSTKALEDDPFTLLARNLVIGGTASGTVTRLERFGAFVELAPGVEGLIHVSELAQGRRINHPKEVVSPGDAVQVQVLSLDPQRRQIGLSIRALMDDPWSQAAKHYPLGAMIQGTVDSVQRFGIFVALETGINGLIPMGQLPEEESKNVYNRFRAGTSIEARVIEVDAARRRLTLSRREDSEQAERAAFAAYRQQATEEPALGTFADLLRKRGK